MNSHSAEVSLLALPLVLLAAAVISVPIARFLKLSAIVAYLVAGVVIGPYGFGIFNTPERIITVAELGVAMLLFQDMAVVPLLALVPLLAAPGQATEQLSLADTANNVALIGGAIAALVIAGRYLLNPFFRLLAWTDAREIMTAAALLIVLG